MRCDVLVISGHFDGGNEFFSERLDAGEYLPVEEMERVSCSASCPGLFSQLKEVYLFGCNTLNAQTIENASAEIGRSLMRAGHSPVQAVRASRSIAARHDESSRDRMRQIFTNVPVIYGFSSVAPLGPTAAASLHRYFRAGGAAEVARGRPSPNLLAHFRPHSMTVTSGLSDADPRALHRRDVCHFADDRLTAAQKLDFVHALMGRDMAEVRMFLTASRDTRRRSTTTRGRRRRSPASSRRSRETPVARPVSALRAQCRAAGRARADGCAGALARVAFRRGKARRADADDRRAAVERCRRRGRDRPRVRAEQGRRARPPAGCGRPRRAAGQALACRAAGLPGQHRRSRTGRAGVGQPRRPEVQIAQVYLRHRPIADVRELRAVSAAIVAMSGGDAQVRALDTLARHRLSDPESLLQIARLFSAAETASVQSAVAGVLIRSDYPPDAARSSRRCCGRIA